MDDEEEPRGDPQEEARPAEASASAQGAAAAHGNDDNASAEGGGSAAGGLSLRPVFVGNLTIGYKAEEVAEIFNRPIAPRDVPDGTYNPIPVDRVDLKRGYCFVFLKDAASATEKEQVVSGFCQFRNS
jgi:arginine/serine-rich splicing factor 4/5/6